jgi:hypothetical protein
MINESGPIMILGTGRCGSTYLQTILCGASNIWIWGEHHGMLRGLFAWAENTRKSKPLNAYSFPFVNEDPYLTMKRDGTRAAWLSSFGPDDISDIERTIVDDLFRRRLPHGKSRWGFKEIRYGAESGVVEHMFELFPEIRLIHVVRDPRNSISSSLRAWRPEIFEENLDPTALASRIHSSVSHEIDRWTKRTNHLETFCAANRANCMTVPIETANEMLPEILEFLGAGKAINHMEVSGEMNAGRKDPAIGRLIDESFDEVASQSPDFIAAAKRVNYAI